MLVPTTPPDDMDTGAMVRRAYERGEAQESYDPYRLVGEVQELLCEQDRRPDLPDGTEAFGILPACDDTSLDRRDAPDPESR